MNLHEPQARQNPRYELQRTADRITFLINNHVEHCIQEGDIAAGRKL